MSTSLTYLTLTLIVFVSSFALLSSGAEFDPYQLNGGLVSAVAGKGYVILATDTRLSHGYEILTRHHISSRIWRVGRSCSSSSSSSSSYNSDALVQQEDQNGAIIVKQPIHVNDGAFVASAGCASDCEALKRQMQMDVRAHTDWNCGRNGASMTHSLSATSVATLLGNTLYSRRTFPFYSFCIVAGMDPPSTTTTGNHEDSGNNSIGVVHVYDAIGSHERVAVAAAGSGREMLQPILDRFFSVSNLRQVEQDEEYDEPSSSPKIHKDGSAIAARHQRVGLSLTPPVKTCVECTCEEAVTLLVRGYRAVSEREITVGDEVVVYIIQADEQHLQQGKDIESRHALSKNDPWKNFNYNGSLEIRRFALKKH